MKREREFKRIGLLGKKIGMTQIFDEDGRQVPVTVMEVGPCAVTAIRTREKHGYSAVQLAFDRVREKRMTRPRLGQMKKAGLPPLKFVREIRTEHLEGLSVGQELKVDQFQVGDFVDVRGTSIGKGFQGVVKRHHFKGALSKSHGTSIIQRHPGSIGASSFPSRVVKGMRMGGHMGSERVTLQSLKVVKVDAEHDLLAVRGAVPGVEGGYLVIRKALKKREDRAWKLPAAAVEAKDAAGETGAAAAKDAAKNAEAGASS